MIDDEKHRTFKLQNVPGHDDQLVVVVKDKAALPELAAKYPGAAFWSAGALARYMEIAKKEIENPADRVADFAQMNMLKIVFGPGGVRFLLDEMDERKYCSETGMDFLWFKKWIGSPPVKEVAS